MPSLKELAANAPWPPDPSTYNDHASIHEKSDRLPQRVLERLHEMPSFEDMVDIHHRITGFRKEKICPACTYIPETWPPAEKQEYLIVSIAPGSGLFSSAMPVSTNQNFYLTGEYSLHRLDEPFIYKMPEISQRKLNSYKVDGEVRTFSNAAIYPFFAGTDEDCAVLEKCFPGDLEIPATELINNPSDSFNLVNVKHYFDCIDFEKSNLRFEKRTHGVYKMGSDTAKGGFVFDTSLIGDTKIFRVKYMASLIFIRSDAFETLQSLTNDTLAQRSICSEELYDWQNF